MEVVEEAAPSTDEVVANITMLTYYDMDVSWDVSLFTDINNDTIVFTIAHNFTGSW